MAVSDLKIQQLSRGIEKQLEESQLSGVLCLCNRSLREFPSIAARYDLRDTIRADISQNRLSVLPDIVCRWCYLEKIIASHNRIQHIPTQIQWLECLTYLDLSHNRLTSIPSAVCHLRLEILLLGHNCLECLPREMRCLAKTLMELDASSNRLSSLPAEFGELCSLRVLNVRNNLLIELPYELCRLKLQYLDVSCNKIAALYPDLRNMSSLVEFRMDENPLVCPSAKLSRRGWVHMFRYLENEAAKHHKRRGGRGDQEFRRRFGLGYSKLIPTDPEDQKFAHSERRHKHRHTIVSDSGYVSSRSSVGSLATGVVVPQTPPPLTLSSHEKCKTLPPPLTSSDGSFVDEVMSACLQHLRTGPVDDDEEPLTPTPHVVKSADEISHELSRQRMVYEEKRKKASYLRHKFLEQQHLSSSDSVEENNVIHGADTDVSRQPHMLLTAARDAPGDLCVPSLRGSGSLGAPPTPCSNKTGFIPTASPITEEPPLLDRSNEFGRAASLEHAPPKSTSHSPTKVLSSPSEVIQSLYNGHIRPIFYMNTSDVSPASECPVAVAPMARSELIDEGVDMNDNCAESVESNADALNNNSMSVGDVSCKNGPKSPRPVSKPPPPPPTSAPSQRAPRRVSTGATKTQDLNSVPKCPSTQSLASVGGTDSARTKTTVKQRPTPHIVPVPPPPASGNTLERRSSASSSSSTLSRREELIELMRRTLEAKLNITLPNHEEGLAEALADGVYLCQFINALRPRSITNIYVSTDQTKLKPHLAKRNTENFVLACRRFGINEGSLCSVNDVLEWKRPHQIATTVQHVSKLTSPSSATTIKKPSKSSSPKTTNV